MRAFTILTLVIVGFAAVSCSETSEEQSNEEVYAHVKFPYYRGVYRNGKSYSNRDKDSDEQSKYNKYRSNEYPIKAYIYSRMYGYPSKGYAYDSNHANKAVSKYNKDESDSSDDGRGDDDSDEINGYSNKYVKGKRYGMSKNGYYGGYPSGSRVYGKGYSGYGKSAYGKSGYGKIGYGKSDFGKNNSSSSESNSSSSKNFNKYGKPYGSYGNKYGKKNNKNGKNNKDYKNSQKNNKYNKYASGRYGHYDKEYKRYGSYDKSGAGYGNGYQGFGYGY